MATTQCPSGVGEGCSPTSSGKLKFLCLKEKKERREKPVLLNYVSDTIPCASLLCSSLQVRKSRRTQAPSFGGVCVPHPKICKRTQSLFFPHTDRG